MKTKRKIPHFLYDKEGNAFQMIFQKRRKGFNLITFLQEDKDYDFSE